jgi:hypothetical protein
MTVRLVVTVMLVSIPVAITGKTVNINLREARERLSNLGDCAGSCASARVCAFVHLKQAGHMRYACPQESNSPGLNRLGTSKENQLAESYSGGSHSSDPVNIPILLEQGAH